MEHSTGKAQVDVLPIQRSDLSSDKLVRAFSNFKKSGVPSRFLLLSEGTWADVAHKVFDEMKAGFMAGKTTLEIAVCEKSYLFDFLGMSRIDLNTGSWNSIAWIDVHGSCFFPVDDGRVNRSEPLGLRTAKRGLAHCRKQLNAEVSSSGRWPDTKLLSDDDRSYIKRWKNCSFPWSKDSFQMPPSPRYTNACIPVSPRNLVSHLSNVKTEKQWKLEELPKSN